MGRKLGGGGGEKGGDGGKRAGKAKRMFHLRFEAKLWQEESCTSFNTSKPQRRVLAVNSEPFSFACICGTHAGCDRHPDGRGLGPSYEIAVDWPPYYRRWWSRVHQVGCTVCSSSVTRTCGRLWLGCESLRTWG